MPVSNEINEESRHYPCPVPLSEEEEYLAGLAMKIGWADDTSELEAAFLHKCEYERAFKLYVAETKMAADPTYVLAGSDTVWFSPGDVDNLYGFYPRPFADPDKPDGPAEAADFDEAMVSADAGDVEAFYEAGVLHREDGPAIIYPGGGEEWYLAGVHHRDGGPAITTIDGSQYWYRGGDLHRDDGPAVCESNGTKAWYVNGKLHRTDGPALVTPEGSQWFVDGCQVPAHGRKMARARAASTSPPSHYSASADFGFGTENRAQGPEL